ncbi:MAG: hypothetical protein R2725_03880 [Solirubrobacterales bacterium]
MSRDLDAAVGAANPYRAERLAGLPLEEWRGDLLDAVAVEPLPTGSPPPRRIGSRLGAAAAVLACLLLAAAGVFTAPGRAVTDWVGAQIGFGEPGGRPALRQFNQFLMATGEGRPGSARVLLVGPTPGYHRRYELIVYETKRKTKHEVPPGPCFRLDLTQERGSYGQGCGILPEDGDFAASGPGGNRDPDSGLMHVSGRVSSAVKEVEATFRGRPIPVELRPVPPELLDRFGLDTPFSFFIGFFRDQLRGGPVEVTARGESGGVLGQAKRRLPSAVPLYRHMCPILAREPHPHPEALGDCRQVLGPRSRW